MHIPWFQNRLIFIVKSIWRFCPLMSLYKRELGENASFPLLSQMNPGAGKETAHWDHLEKFYQRTFLG